MSADILDRLKRRFPLTTHWEGCENHHDLCAAFREIERLRKELDDTQSLLRIVRASREGFELAAQRAVMEFEKLENRVNVTVTMHHASQGEGCPICKTDNRCRTRAVLEGE